MSLFLVTGGAQRRNAAWMHESHHYSKAILASVDVESGATRTLLEYTSPPHACPDDRPSHIFKSATLRGDRLYLCTQTEVLVLAWPSLEQVRYISLPSFNDVHHVLPVGDNLLVASTGLDMVVTVDPEGRAIHHESVLDEDPWLRFDRTVDYRKIASTKPHAAHPNFLFLADGLRWVTRFEQRDALCLDDRTRRVDVGLERVHDGNPYRDRIWLTTVDGHLVAGPVGGGPIDVDIDLNALTPGEDSLGWCRSLHMSGDHALVGFSRIRSTRFRDNLRWMAKAGRTGPGFKPTRLGLYNVTTREWMRDIDLESSGLSAVFCVLPCEPSP